MFGQRQFAGNNTLINARFAEFDTLIAVHRGTGIGSIAENTASAVTAAVASGGDIVELDVIASADGDFFAFHDGNEPRLLGIEANLRSLPTKQISALSYVHLNRPGRIARVEPLLDLLAAFPGGPLLNIDRSWPWWGTLLPALDKLSINEQLLLKCPADHQQVELLRRHPVKYPFIPICRTLTQAHQYLEDPSLNTVGVELLTSDLDGPFLDPSTIADLRNIGVFTMVNAEVLNTGTDLFAGYDDEVAVLCSPDQGWGLPLDLGVDVIQTDWPWLLRDYRNVRTASRSPNSKEESQLPAGQLTLRLHAGAARVGLET